MIVAADASVLVGEPLRERDNDFLGCGCPTWTVDTLRHELMLS
jgi:hypothetical protein